MAEGIKISEFEEIESLQAGCCFPVLSEGANKKIKKSKLFSQFQSEILNSGSMTQKLRETHPVGSYVIHTDNPASILGYGTWGGFSFGRVTRDQYGTITGMESTYIKVDNNYYEVKMWIRIA